MRKSGALRIGIVLLLASVAAGVFALVGRAGDPVFGVVDSSIGPGIVDANANVLVKASWQYLDNPTLTHSSVRFTIPAGWTLVDGAPDLCTQSSTTTVTCPRGTIRQGDVIAQAVELTTSSALNDKAVKSDLLFYEGPENPGRAQIKSAGVVHTTVIAAGSGEPNKVGKCVSNTGGNVSTDPGAGNSETSADVPANPEELCTPISITERIRLNAGEACLPDVACVLDIVTTDSAHFPADDPIVLKITFRGQGINSLPLIFKSTLLQTEVPACDDDAVADPDPCYSDKKTGQQSVKWTLNWTGLDPTWSG